MTKPRGLIELAARHRAAVELGSQDRTPRQLITPATLLRHLREAAPHEVPGRRTVERA